MIKKTLRRYAVTFEGQSGVLTFVGLKVNAALGTDVRTATDSRMACKVLVVLRRFWRLFSFWTTGHIAAAASVRRAQGQLRGKFCCFIKREGERRNLNNNLQRAEKKKTSGKVLLYFLPPTK